VKKQKHMKRRHSQKRGSQQPKQRIVTLSPEELAKFARQAEAYAIPIIVDLQVPPEPALLLLAQYTHVLATGSEQVTIESAMQITTTVLSLWQSGVYTPGPEYPYTLEETLHGQQQGAQKTCDYADCFQPLRPTNHTAPRGRANIAGGLVLHPTTRNWQIWLMLDGSCDQLAAYCDCEKAHHALGELIVRLRQGSTSQEIAALYQRLRSQSDAEPKQIPFEMAAYLLDHLDSYKILL
jgi:hypothetical protein